VPRERGGDAAQPPGNQHHQAQHRQELHPARHPQPQAAGELGAGPQHPQGHRTFLTKPKRIKTQDKRDYLEVVIKNHILDLQNIELEIHLQIQEKTIYNLKNIIENQQRILEDNQINLKDDQTDLDVNY